MNGPYEGYIQLMNLLLFISIQHKVNKFRLRYIPIFIKFIYVNYSEVIVLYLYMNNTILHKQGTLFSISVLITVFGKKNIAQASTLFLTVNKLDDSSKLVKYDLSSKKCIFNL